MMTDRGKDLFFSIKGDASIESEKETFIPGAAGKIICDNRGNLHGYKAA
ncbi:MAG: hypothetical protein WA395_14545 [Nitrososphaeraceae archaeon]